MNYFSGPGRQAHAWRRLADNANESGETPLIALGLDSLYRGGLLKLLALSRLARQNSPARAIQRFPGQLHHHLAPVDVHGH